MKLGDLLLFEWGVFKWPWSPDSPEVFLVDLVRQFPLLTKGGDYDRMEQVHCTMSFEPTRGSASLRTERCGRTASMSSGSYRWSAVNCLSAVRTRKALVVHVEHEQL
jgi:hypothetical protein